MNRMTPVVAAAFCVFATAASAQPPSDSPSGTNRPTVITPGHHDVTPPLRDLPPLPPRFDEKETPHPPHPVRGGPVAGPHVPDPKLQTTAPSLNAITPLASFDGIGNISGVLPPDTNGDVSASHYVQWVNLAFAVYDKAGNRIYGPVDGKTLWQGFGGPCESSNDGDPIVLYDELAGRWLMSQFALPNYPSGPYYQCIAVSTTDSPLGSWSRYSYSFSKLNDYPKFGVWPDGYYMSINQFSCNFFFCNWAGQGVVAFERSQMLIGGPARGVYFDLASNNSLGGMLPADVDGPTAPPPGSPNYFVQVDDQPDQLQLWEFKVDWANASNSTFTQRALLPTSPFDSNMCGGSRNCIPQAGTSAKIDAIADRLMYRLQYRNFGTHESLVTNHTVDVGLDRGGVRWYEMRNPHTAPAIYQQGTYAPSADTLNRWMGSAAMDKDGNLAIGYSVSNSLTFPAIRFTGRLASDPLDTLTVAESDLRAGSGSQTHSSGRWGDYSMLAVDPSDGCTFWYTTEYYDAGATAAGWKTNIGSFTLATCGAAATKPSAPSGLTANAVSDTQINLAWTDNSGNETQFRIERCQPASGCVFQQIATVGANTTSYSNTSLSPSTTYRYRVIAANSLASDPSNEADATTLAPPPPPPLVHIHVGTLMGSSVVNGKSGWRATVVIPVLDSADQPVANATVSGSWSNGYTADVTCTSGADGKCSVSTPKLSINLLSVKFTVSRVVHGSDVYDETTPPPSIVVPQK